MLLYYLETYTMRSVIFNDRTELSAKILELIYKSNKDSVTLNSKPSTKYTLNLTRSPVMDSFVIVDMYIFIIIAFL